MTFVILHLENCADCFAAVQNFAPPTENQSVLLFAETEKFHLDYEEHLRPFVDNEADSATREIVESHTQSCGNCAFQLRELREFSESLRLREIEKKSVYAPTFLQKIGEWLHQIPHNLTFKIIFPLLLLIVGSVAIFILFRQPQSKDTANLNQTIQNDLSETNQNPIIVKTVNQNTENRQKINSNNFQNNANVKEIQPKPIDETAAELAGLPAALREKIETAWNTKKLSLPSFLPSLQEKLNLRGEDLQEKIKIYPNGEAVRETSPNFAWKTFGNGNYTVEIFDENNQSVETSAIVNKTDWTPKINLERGKIYKWEVRAENSQSYSGKFKVLDKKTADDLNKLSGKSPLVRGIAFASAGVLTNAEIELRRAVKDKNDSEAAKIFLRQIKK